MKTQGMTLVELMIVVLICGILAITMGAVMVNSFAMWQKASTQTTSENDFRYVRRRIEHQFRSATTDPAIITQTNVPNDTLEFASYFDNYNLSNQYTQNQYTTDSNNNLVHNIWNATENSGTLNPASPWGTTPDATETIMPNVTSVQFQWSGVTVSTSTVQVTVQQTQSLPNGASYINSNTFTVKSRNRG